MATRGRVGGLWGSEGAGEVRATRAVVRCARAARRGASWRVQSCPGSAGELCEGVESDVAEAVDDDDELLLLFHLALLQRVPFLQGVASLRAARRRARRRLLLELSSSLSSSSSASLPRSPTRAKHNALHCPLHHKLYCPLYTGLRFSANLRARSPAGQRSLAPARRRRREEERGDARAQALEAVLGLQDRLVREALDVEARLAAGGRAGEGSAGMLEEERERGGGGSAQVCLGADVDGDLGGAQCERTCGGLDSHESVSRARVRVEVEEEEERATHQPRASRARRPRPCRSRSGPCPTRS